MNILVTGANGQLGRCIKDVIDTIGNGHADHYVGEPDYYIFAGHNDLDITDANAVDEFVKKNFINVIINCAAYTNVDKAQTDRDTAYDINAIGPLNLAFAAKSVGAVLIHISTDYVFGGEYDSPLPPMSRNDENFVPAKMDENYYGYSKMIGEHLIEQSGCRYLIFRTSWLYSEYGKNFVKTMHNLHNEGKTPKVVCDQVGSPTYARDLAEFIVHIIKCNNADSRYLSKTGIYNFANKSIATWYDIAKRVCGVEGVVPCETKDFPTTVKRPKYSVLDVSKTEADFGFNIRYWGEAIEQSLYNLNKQSE